MKKPNRYFDPCKRSYCYGWMDKSSTIASFSHTIRKCAKKIVSSIVSFVGDFEKIENAKKSHTCSFIINNYDYIFIETIKCLFQLEHSVYRVHNVYFKKM